MRAQRQGGFTLIELMIVVAIIGVLAAVAIPAFMKYMREAKTAEAPQMLQKIATQAQAYYLEGRRGRGITGSSDAARFPETEGLTPASTCCTAGRERCMPAASHWTDPTWETLHFSLDDPHYYRYEFISDGVGTGAMFTARAHGDLDCDGVLSTFETTGKAQYKGHDVTGQGSIWSNKKLE